jgi:hypothetical protein
MGRWGERTNPIPGKIPTSNIRPWCNLHPLFKEFDDECFEIFCEHCCDDSAVVGN